MNALLNKISKISSEIDKISKAGVNQSQSYKYVRESDVMRIIREKLFEHKVHVLFSTENRKSEREGKAYLETIDLITTFCDLESDDKIELRFPGSGADYGPGDKAIYMAITGGIKYALLKTFLIETTDDPEYENKEETVERKKDLVEKKAVENMPVSIKEQLMIISEMKKLDKKALWAHVQKLNYDWKKVQEWLNELSKK